MVKMVNLMSWIFYYNLKKATQHCKPTIPACALSCFSRIRIFAAPRTTALQAPLSTGFPRQEYWSGLPRPPPGHLSNLGIEPAFPELQTDSLPLSHWEAPCPNHPRGGESNLSLTSTASGGHQLPIYSWHAHSNHTQQSPVPTDAANSSHS